MKKHDKQLFASIQKKLLEHNAVYTYTDIDRFKSKSERNILNVLKFKNENGLFSVPVPCTFPHVTLEKNEFQELSIIGENVYRALKETKKLLANHKNIINHLASPELEYELKLKDTIPPFWMRLDIIKHHSSEKFFVVDINLQPGAMYISHITCSSYMEMVGDYTDFSSLNCYTLDKLWSEILNYCGDNFPSIVFDDIYVCDKTGHGLSQEYKAFACYIKNKFGTNIRYCDILSLPENKKSLIIKAFRFRDLSGIEKKHIFKMINNGSCFLPGFNLWQENNSWFYFWKKYDVLGEMNTNQLLDFMPKTFLMSESNDSIYGIDLDKKFKINSGHLSRMAVKTGGSSGGRGVHFEVENDKTIDLTTLINKEPSVLQEIITPERKEVYGFKSNGHLGWKKMFGRYCIFYIGGKFLGGTVTVSPSIKVGVRNNLFALNLPIFWKKELEK